MTVTDTAALIETPHFKRAWRIHGQHYDGLPVTDCDQAFYDVYIRGLLDTLDTLGVGVRIWLLYATKYVTS